MYEEMYKCAVSGLKSFCDSIGAKDIVIGLSGGMDSALVLVMCIDALGPEHVHAYALPGPYSSQQSFKDAYELCDALGIKLESISISGVYDAAKQELDKACDGSLSNLAAENIQARCRMLVLMALANNYGWMMVNTGNKSESYLGYSTMYGDMAGAYAPLGDVFKTESYEMARWRNAQSLEENGYMLIPESIFTKAPSAELSENQSDESSLGNSYERIDRILKVLFENKYDKETLLSEGFSEEEIQQLLSRVKTNAFKRAYEPPAPFMDHIRNKA